MRELLIGCGSNRDRKLHESGKPTWDELVTLDMNADHKPDVVCDLNKLPLPFADDEFDSISAFDTLEHVGQMGDWKFFFDQWSDFWRMLKPGGKFYCLSPTLDSIWAVADPGHTRILSQPMLIFLHQPSYVKGVGKTPMTDYRFCYKADFDIHHAKVDDTGQLGFVLQAVKPSRYGTVRE